MKQIITLLILIMSLFSTTLYAKNASQPITVTAKNPVFTLQLPSNPTTGYSWQLQKYNANLITPINHGFQKARTNLMGAPGVELWTFKAKPAFFIKGKTTIHMIYVRPWRGGGKGDEKIVTVIARR